MRLAASLVICLATLVCAREWVTTTEIESQRLDEDDEAASSMEEIGVETGYSITCYDSTRIPACDVAEVITLLPAGPQTTSIHDGMIVVDGDELLYSTQMTAQPIEEEHSSSISDTVTAETTAEASDIEVTMSWSSSSLPASTHMMSRTTSGSVSSTLSAGPGVESVQGSMSLMTTQSRASSTSLTSSSARSTGAAPIATGELAMMAGAAAMVLLVAVL
ncbi:hypothetical protein M752DRAFT_340132 [Aspergillus phoenicis ATCC 13157]|uniref:GPI anchored protein n=1 Tax=Aspergillus phoenicis ATCC 13157 TaxID=1353007 RepID=A0A370P599_ASPPH|nr:hypothetical protein CBS147346_8584 [Aspergillus niger]RDK36917.1 hypothetical protein M752DRAFT_340132 [Aspergillus phoenicis ATCC 13157]GLA26804.1 hypothetical protein AnigIFM63326_003972 [Aspergillus niger]